MWTLIKRDIRSTRSGWLFILLVMIGIAAITRTSFSKIEGESTLVSFPFSLILLGIVSYATVAHICRVEEESGVKERMYQIPISVEKMILSRYLSSFIALTIIYGLTFGIVILFSLGNLPTVEEAMPVIFLFLHAVLLIISIYLPFYFGKNSNTATWLVRLFFMFWLIYAILAIPLFHYEYRERFAQIPTYFYETFFQQLFIDSLFFILISFIISVIAYRLKVKQKNASVYMVLYISLLLLTLLVTPLLAEGRALKLLEEEIATIQLETVTFEDLVYDGEEEEQVMRVQVTISAPGQMEEGLIEQTIVYIDELDFQHKNLNYFEQKSEVGEKQYFSHQFDYVIQPNDNVIELKEKIKENKIDVQVSHRWLEE